jgi:hypothetical protein
VVSLLYVTESGASAEVAAVGSQRVRRAAPLHREPGEVALDLGGRVAHARGQRPSAGAHDRQRGIEVGIDRTGPGGEAGREAADGAAGEAG